MAGRVQRVFDRYAARHLALSQPGPMIPDAQGNPIGQITRISLQNSRLCVEGEALAQHLGLEHPVLELAGRRRLWSEADTLRFRLELPFSRDEASLSYAWQDQTLRLPLPGFSPRRLQAARLALWPRFAAASLWALPSAWRWLRHHDLTARARIKQLLGLGAMVEDRPLETVVFPTQTPLLSKPDCAVSIILPVYQGFDLLAEVLDRVQRHTDLPWRLLLIDDASPDPRVAPFLRHWVGSEPRASLLENPENLGFIGTMNRAFAHLNAAGGFGAAPVILLNADAFVPQAWASRLVAPLLADASVASVTPMSNDAELMTTPVICAPLDLAQGAVDQIDAVAQLLLPDLPEAPTGVGFCMALSPHYLTQVPQFDPVFGRGYGEEVDWCQRVRALGGRHLCLSNLFVEHRGGTSFGSAAKQQLIRQNSALISQRYPRFDIEVQQFIADDPLLTPRLALGLAWVGSLGVGSLGAGSLAAGSLGTGDPIPLYIGHAMGGGAEHYLQTRIAADLARLGAAVVLRLGGEYRWQIEVHSKSGITRGCSNDRALILRLLHLIPQRQVIYSCGVGDADPAALPQLLLDLAGGQRLDILVHDYLTISPAFTLLDSKDAYHGVPDLAGPQARHHRAQRPDGTWVDLAAWRRAWGAALVAATEVTVFSQDSQALMRQAYPDLGHRLVLRPHQLAHTPPRLIPHPNARPVIGVLGNIGGHKGAGVLAVLSQHLARVRDGDLVLLGNLDPAYDLRRPARVHGPYTVPDIPDLVARYGITCWLIPSICPETFSFTTHEALATGLPVICFDLGAQAEAVRRAMAEGAAGAVVSLRNGRADPAVLVAAATRLSAISP